MNRLLPNLECVSRTTRSSFFVRERLQKKGASEINRLRSNFLLCNDAPTGIRIPVLALKGPRPSPLDDGGDDATPFYSNDAISQFAHRHLQLVIRYLIPTRIRYENQKVTARSPSARSTARRNSVAPISSSLNPFLRHVAILPWLIAKPINRAASPRSAL